MSETPFDATWLEADDDTRPVRRMKDDAPTDPFLLVEDEFTGDTSGWATPRERGSMTTHLEGSR